MSKKKLILLIAVITFSTLLMGSAPANRSNQDPPFPIPSQKAVLTNTETGRSYELPVITKWVGDLGEGKMGALYQADIPQALLSSRGGIGRWRYDPTRSAKVYVYIEYGCAYLDHTQYMSLHVVKGMWQRISPSVTCTRLRIASRCQGHFYGGGFCSRYEARYVYKPGSSTYYQWLPSWRGKLVAINKAGYYQSGIATATLKRGSTRWSFSISITNPCLW